MSLEKLIKRVRKLNRKLLMAEANHDTIRAERKHRKLIKTLLRINKKKTKAM